MKCDFSLFFLQISIIFRIFALTFDCFAMLRRLALYLLLLLALPLSLLAQESSSLVLARESVAGRVVMTDGEVMSFPSLFLPDYTEPGLLASSTVGYHDSLMIFDANDIRYIEFWHPDHPDSVHRLYSVLLKRQPRRIAHFWAVLDIVTPYGFLVMAYPRYHVSEDGGLERITLYGNRVFSYPKPFALQYGKSFYESWPLDYDSPILDYLNRDNVSGAGTGQEQMEQFFDNGFEPGDFFEYMPDMDMGM